jgi:hypothetical protein
MFGDRGSGNKAQRQPAFAQGYGGQSQRHKVKKTTRPQNFTEITEFLKLPEKSFLKKE